jgi:predicted PurR-regulated permease PerM
VLIAAVFTGLLLLFLARVAEILLLLFIAVLFGIFLSAMTDVFQRRLHLPRPLGVTLAVLLTFAGLVGIGYLVVPPVAEQTQELIEASPEVLESWDQGLVDLVRRNPLLADVFGVGRDGQTSPLGGVLAEVRSWAAELPNYLASGLEFLIHFVSVLIMGIFLAVRPGQYREGLILLAPPRHRELVRDILTELGATLRAWITGQIIAMVTLALMTWVGLWILGVPYALAFGVFTGLVAIVPFFGTLVSSLLPAAFVLGAGAGKALLVIALGFAIHLIEANLIVPMVMQHQVKLPPVLTLLSVLVMGTLLHAVGLIVAVPVLATVMVIGRRIYIDRVLEGKGFRRTIRDEAIRLKVAPRDAYIARQKPGGVPSWIEQAREDGATLAV